MKKENNKNKEKRGRDKFEQLLEAEKREVLEKDQKTNTSNFFFFVKMVGSLSDLDDIC